MVQIREMLDRLDELTFDKPMNYTKYDDMSYDFSFETPDGESHDGIIEFSKSVIDTTAQTGDDTKKVYMEYAIDGTYEAFDTQGMHVQIVSTVIDSIKDWFKSHPDYQFLEYTAKAQNADKTDANNRQRVYSIVTKLLSKHHGFDVVINDPSAGHYLLKLRTEPESYENASPVQVWK